MKRSELSMLLSLAALWGASYLFIRLGAGEFGAVPLAGGRAGGAALLLLPLLAWRGGLACLRRRWWAIAVVGITNSALPFVLFSFAALTIPAGLSAMFTAATPLFTALIGWLWLRESLEAPRIAGLALGFAGVLWLVWDKAGLQHDAAGKAIGLAALACLAAALLYGFSANFTRKYLADVPPLTVAAGSQLASALLLCAPAAWLWPATQPSAHAWLALGALTAACTALAYVLFFRLIAKAGPARAMTALFLIPAFGVLWGALFLGERITPSMLPGCAVILAGTALTTGIVRGWSKRLAS
ncbi:DMT family transporter [Cupriavidus basilensis]